MDIDHVGAVADAERHGHLVLVGQCLHQRLGHPADGKGAQQRMAERRHLVAEMILAVGADLAQVTHLRQRVGQSGDGRLGKAGTLGDFLVAERSVDGPESAQDLQPARQRDDFRPVICLGCHRRTAFRSSISRSIRAGVSR